jgi:hypothetical protein
MGASGHRPIKAGIPNAAATKPYRAAKKAIPSPCHTLEGAVNIETVAAIETKLAAPMTTP